MRQLVAATRRVAECSTRLIAATLCAALWALPGPTSASAATPPFRIATIAGIPYDPSGDGGLATLAAVDLANGGVAFRDGNLYVTDGARVRKIAPNGVITTVVGLLDPVVHQPIPGFSGDGGPALGAQIRSASSLEFDTAGNLYLADLGNSCVRKVTARVIGGVAQPLDGTEIIGTIAGMCTVVGNSGDSGMATSAKLNAPRGMAIDSATGALYIADQGNSNVRKVDVAGTITTIAGTGVAGFSDDGTPAVVAALNLPSGVAIDPGTGDIYVADLLNSRVRRISAGIITTFVGTGTTSAVGNLNEGGAAIAANVRPVKIRIAGGILYIVDSGIGMVRKVGLGFGIITTLAGTGLPYVGAFPPTGDGGPALTAFLGTGASGVQDATFDGSGSLFIADASNRRVRFAANSTTTIFGQTVTGGNIATVVGPPGIVTFGGDGGPASAARLFGPQGLVFDPSGNLYVTDGGNNRVRQIDTSSTITTIAGDGIGGFSGVPGPATAAAIQPGNLASYLGNLYLTNNFTRVLEVASNSIAIVTNTGGASTPPAVDGTAAIIANMGAASIAFDAAGNLYVGDTANNRIWRVDATGTAKTVVGSGSVIVDGVSVVSTTGTQAHLFGPAVIAFDPSGNLYTTDGTRNRILKITAQGANQPLDGTETVSIFAGTGIFGFSGDNGAATAANLNSPNGLVFDAAANLYLSDGANYRIRKVDSSGTISTVAGTGAAGFAGDGGLATSAQLRGGSLTADAFGNVYLSDGLNNVVRVLDNTLPTITVTATKADSSPYTAGTWTNQTVTVHFACADTGSGVASCPSDQVLSADGITASASGTATDKAGNTAMVAFGPIKIDKTPPSLSPFVTPNPVQLNGNAVATPGASDATSGVASQSCGPIVTSSVGTKSVTCTAKDNAGNTNSATVNYMVVAGGTVSVTIQNGQTFNFVNQIVAGYVTMTGGTVVLDNSTVASNFLMSGGSLVLVDNSSVQGTLQITGASTFSLGPGHISGNLEIQGLRPVSGQNQVCGVTVAGDLDVQYNGAPVVIGSASCHGNTVSGALLVTSNTAATEVYGNTVGHDLDVTGNSASTMIFSNTVKQALQCSGNSASMLTGGGNKALQKQGQCAGF